MTTQQSQLVSLSQILLVACDQSYAGSLLEPVPGQPSPPLAVYPDAPLRNTFEPPYSVVDTGFVVHKTFEDQASGFKAVLYKNESSKEIILAMGGTDGTDLRDWWSDVTHYGWNQWSRNRVAVLQALDGPNGLISQLTGPNDEKPRIHFTGQSLGGALAQYAAYEFVETHVDYPRANLSLVTFNGLGGVAALSEELPHRVDSGPITEYPRLANSEFNASLVSSFGTIAHYGSANDLVWRLGGGHLGEQVYSFTGLDFSKIDPTSGEPYLLDTVSAHKIETGYYYPLTRFAQSGVAEFEESVSGGTLSPAQLGQSYLKLGSLQKIASILGNLFRQSATSEAGALAKLLFGGLGGLTLADSSEVNALVGAYVESRHRAGLYAGKDEEYAAAKDTDWGLRLKIAAGATIVGQVAGFSPFGLFVRLAGAIAFAPVYKLIEGIRDDDGEFILRNTFDLQRQGPAVPESAFEDALERSSLVGAAVGVTAPGDLPLGKVGELARDDLDGFAQAMVAGTDWQYAVSRYLVGRAGELGRRDLAQEAFGEFWAYSRQAAEGNPTLLAGIQSELSRFTSDWGGALANLSSDLTAPKDTPIQIEGVTQYAQKRMLWDGALAGLEGLLDLFVGTAQAAETRSALTQSIEEVRSAAQTVVVLPGRRGNPFDALSYDPDAAPTSPGQLKEGSLSTFTAYLPYEAGAGGQRLKLKLEGANVEALSVLAGGDEIEPQADGTFTLTIAEGEREASFEIAALADLDASASFTLAAQLVSLVDGAEVATHLAHDEATIALGAGDEQPPAATREIRGDWAPTPYTDPNTGQTSYKYDDLGNIERLAGVPNTTGFQEPDLKLDGSEGGDRIVTGDYDDTAYGNGGNDAIYGSDLIGSVFFGGSGDDWMEAGDYANHASDYVEFEYLKRTIKLGEDRIYGGAGNDRIYGDSETTVDALYDPATVPTGLAGDWLSGGSGSDCVYGGAGDDVLMGGAGEDQLVGGAGMDVLLGDDQYFLRPEGNYWRVVHPNFGDTTAGFGGFEVGLFPVVNVGLAYPDNLWLQTGDRGFDYYKNAGGADVLIGGAGKDILIGELGDDTLYGGTDDDILAGWEGADQLYGGEGNDLMAGDFGRYEQVNQRIVSNVGLVGPGVLGSVTDYGSAVDFTGNDFLDGGAGNDIEFGEAGDDVVLGGDGTDTLYGDATYLPEPLHGNDLVDGGAGDDTLYGNGGDDKVYGGDGDDVAYGGTGDDLVDGGAGSDTLSGDAGDDKVFGGEGTDSLVGGGGSDELHGGGGDDQLDGGDDSDVLWGDSGADHLVGGLGDDALYGGSGEDVIDGGDGNDLIDGGAGADTGRGGAGDDIYVLSLGYGQDLIEDSEGRNTIRFGPGIAVRDLRADLDAASFTATLDYGFDGDAVAFDLAHFQIDGLQFADGTAWAKKDLLSVVPALVSSGTSTADVLTGRSNVRNDLQGFGGDDRITGGANEDSLAGGDGNDRLNGQSGSDLYVLQRDETGIDTLSDSGVDALIYLNAYYADFGITDWAYRGEHGGMYRVYEAEAVGLLYFDTYEEAYAAVSYAPIDYIEPVPSIVPLVRRDDTAAIDQLVSDGILSRDVVAFGNGLALGDLSITVTVPGATADAHPEEPWYGGGTLSVRWNGGAAGFDVKVPDVNYGFAGTNLLTDGSRDDTTPGAWRGYRLGEGIETFQFADGTMLSLEDVLAQATVVKRYGYNFERGSGQQTIDASWASVDFGADIAPAEVVGTRDGVDLVFALADGSAEGRVVGWYADSAAVPPISFSFADGTTYDTDAATRLGLTQYGSSGYDDLVADPDFASALYGLGGNDTVVGGAGNDLIDSGGSGYLEGGPGDDTYVYTPGYGSVEIWDSPYIGGGGLDTLRFGAGIAPQDVTVSKDYGTVTLSIGDGGDRVMLDWWEYDAGGTVERIQFADGTVWGAAAIEALVLAQSPTEGDDLVQGTSGGDVLDGLGGNDQVLGFAGSDTLYGGAGEDFLEGDAGADLLYGGAGADDLKAYGGGASLLDAGAGDDYVYDEGTSFIVGGPGDDWIDAHGEGEVIAFNPGDGNDTVYAVGALTLSLGGGVQPGALTLSQDGTDLLIDVAGSDSIRVTREWEDDPTAWPSITLQMYGSVHTYDFNSVIADFEAQAADDPNFVLPLGAVLAAHEISVSQTDALGGALAWQCATTGSTSALTAEDLRAMLADPGFGFTPQPIAFATANQAPVLTGVIGDQATLEDTAFELTVTDAFSDPDAGDVLTYAATLGGGMALPAWLTLDAKSATLVGTPSNDDVGVLEISVTATDTAGESVFDRFRLDVFNVNDAPIAADDAGAAQEDAGPVSLSAAVLLENDTDVDIGDTKTIVAVTDSTAGAAVQLSGGEVVYNPGNLFQGLGAGATTVDSFGYTMADATGATSEASVAMTITGVNDAPVLALPIGRQTGREGQAFAFLLPLSTFSDVDAGDALTFSASLGDGGMLPPWLGFDAASGELSGTPGLSGGGEFVVRVTATDTAQSAAFADFALTVFDSNAAGNRIVGTRGNDTLNGTAADEVLDGQGGNDLLSGGAGADSYLYGRGGGDDTIVEAGRAGEIDALRFGPGIRADALSVQRRNDDLVIGLKDGHGSVTVKGWFGSDEARVERVEFADGKVWDEAAIRSRARSEDACSGDPAPQHGHHHHDEHDRRGGDKGHPKSEHESDDDPASEAVRARLAKSPRFDFEALMRELGNGPRGPAPLPEAVRRQWSAAASYASALGGFGDDGPGAPWRSVSDWARLATTGGARGFGFEGSVGAARGPEGLKSLEGLREGFERL